MVLRTMHSLVPCTVLYCAVLHCTTLYWAVLHCTAPYCTAPCACRLPYPEVRSRNLGPTCSKVPAVPDGGERELLDELLLVHDLVVASQVGVVLGADGALRTPQPIRAPLGVKVVIVV